MRATPPSSRFVTERYGEELGAEARARQEELARAFHVCCGEPKPGRHHEGCSKYDPDEPAGIHPDQEALL